MVADRDSMAPMTNREHELPDDIEALKRMVIEQGAELANLKLQIAKLQRMQFGRSSERIQDQIAQLEFGLDTLEADRAERESEEETAAPAARERGKLKPARKPLPAHLPRERVMHEGPCACAKCGGTLTKLGEDVTEVLEVEKRFKVIAHVRPRLACRSCEAITQPAPPSLPITRGLAGPGLLAQVLISKYCDHLPLYRQSDIFAREGVELDRSTLAGWVGQCTSLLRPLIAALAKEVMASTVLHGDDTVVPVLDPGRGKTREGRLWVYVRDERPFAGQAPPAAVYFYSPDRKGEWPQAHLKGFTGILHADGYAGFNRLFESGAIKEAACWAHARRKFFDVFEAIKSPIAEEALTRIRALYAIEDEITGLSAAARHERRQAASKLLTAALKLWAEETLPKLSGKSNLAKAFRYMLSRWDALTRFLDDGRLAIDNNAAERAMRVCVLGRKNYLFAGSDKGGERAAALYSLVETAKLNGLNPERYLRDVLARIADHPVNSVTELLPWTWAAAQSQQARAA
jgi:transposase